MDRFATIEDFQRQDPKYFNDRWLYMSAVIDEMRQMQFDSCLELGTMGFQLVMDSDTMDIQQWDGLTYFHDATRPFPIDDKQYDLFVALQVWEHLGDSQTEAFSEVMRISRQAILSFPYLWDCPADPSHHNLGHDTFGKWTLGVAPVKRFITHARAVYVFDFSQPAVSQSID